MNEPLSINALEDLALQLRKHAEPQPRSRRRWTLAVAMPATAVLGAVAVLVLSSGARPVDAAAEARAVLNLDDTILHYTYVATHTLKAGDQRTKSEPQSEGSVWIASDRYRYLDPHHRQSGRLNGRQESSFIDGVATTYTAGAHSQRVTVGITDPDAAIAPDFAGLSTDLRSGLARGTITDLGTRTYAGRDVRRLRIVQKRGNRGSTITITYDVDPSTFAPRHIREVGVFKGRATTLTAITEARITQFQRLPRTAKNLQLFVIPIPPGTAITKYQAVPGRRGTRKICARPAKPGVPLCP
jgi:hypothetical protein